MDERTTEETEASDLREQLVEDLAEATEAPEEPEIDPRDEIIAKLSGEKDHLLRMVAEQQTITRRLREQAEQQRKFAAEPVAKELIPVLDNFERTLRAAQEGASIEALTEGVRVIDRQLRKALEGAGISRIAALGAKFDPALHEAAAAIPNNDYDDETVIEEIAAGYQMHDRVIRPAQVVVSQKS
jgi:molecular chaperone GrpE